MSTTLRKLLAAAVMRDFGDGFRAKIAARESNQATFDIQFGAHKIRATGFPTSLQTYDFKLGYSTRAMSFACAALAELTEGTVLPLVRKYYEPVYGDLGLHYPSRYQFVSCGRYSATSKPLFRVEYDYMPRTGGGKGDQYERFARN